MQNDVSDRETDVLSSTGCRLGMLTAANWFTVIISVCSLHMAAFCTEKNVFIRMK